MSDHKFIGKNYQTPDLVAKVTGRAKYAEDFRAEGMLFCKLLLSPEPHARVRHIDARAALAMRGVAAILTADELPVVRPDPDPTGARGVRRRVALPDQRAGVRRRADSRGGRSRRGAGRRGHRANPPGAGTASVRHRPNRQPAARLAPTRAPRATCSPSAAGSSGSNGRRRTCRKSPPVEFPGTRKRARRQRLATSTLDSSRPTSFWTRRSFSNRRRTRRSSRARRWPTGGMESCTSTARRRASPRRFPSWRGGSGSTRLRSYSSPSTAAAGSAARRSAPTAWPSRHCCRKRLAAR